jgi:DNA-binding IclR family transcriptional regulator
MNTPLTLRQDAPAGNNLAGNSPAESTGAGSTVTGVGVLDRSVLLLNLLADGPRTLRWLASASGLPRPTAYRLLVALEGHRLASRDGTGAFQLGPRLTELAVRAGPAVDLAAVAGPVLTRLHEATGESVQLYVRSGDRRLCVAARNAVTGLLDSVPVGALLPLEVGSGGKVLLAWSPAAAQPPGGITAELATELAAVRKRGWAASVAEREVGVASVSAPVLVGGTSTSTPAGTATPGGELLGALCLSGPASRLGQAPGRRLAPQVIEAAAELAGLAARALAR